MAMEQAASELTYPGEREMVQQRAVETPQDR